jgi:glycosyltransferase involved in cell wall biosynthesis
MLVSYSDWARDSLINDYGVRPEKIRVLASGAASEYFDIGEQRKDQLGDRVRFLFVGNGFARKGGPQLVEALQPLLATGTCELHIATNDDVQSEPNKNIHVHRGLSSNSLRLRELYERADVFVLPTLGDCLPVVVMEATAAGLPVVTTDVGALREAVLDGESGMLLEPGDVSALRLAMQTLVAQPELRWRMGRAGHALARIKFDARQNNERLFGLLHEIGSGQRVANRAS